MRNAKSVQQNFRNQAKKWRQKAREASTDNLKEYYRGRADEALAAADALTKLTFDPEKHGYQP